MAFRNAERTMADDISMYTFTIKAAASAPATIATQLGTNLTTANGKWITGFEIRSPLGWRYGLNSGHTAPTRLVAAYEDWAPPVCGRKVLDATYVRSSTGGAATTATIIIYTGDRDGA